LNGPTENHKTRRELGAAPIWDRTQGPAPSRCPCPSRVGARPSGQDPCGSSFQGGRFNSGIRALPSLRHEEPGAQRLLCRNRGPEPGSACPSAPNQRQQLSWPPLHPSTPLSIPVHPSASQFLP